MSINEISPTNYSAIGSFMGHPKTAASEYQSKNISRTDSQENFAAGRNRKNIVFRSHVNPYKEEKRDRSLGIMSIDSAMNFLQKRGDSPVKNY